MPPLTFFENQKNCPEFGKKAVIVFIFRSNFRVKIVLRVSRRNNSKLFRVGFFLLVFLANSLLKYPNSTKPTPFTIPLI